MYPILILTSGAMFAVSLLAKNPGVSAIALSLCVFAMIMEHSDDEDSE